MKRSNIMEIELSKVIQDVAKYGAYKYVTDKDFTNLKHMIKLASEFVSKYQK